MRDHVVIYARISSNREDNTDGVDRQVTECRRIAEDQKLTVVDTLIDDDLSATDPTVVRPGWRRILEMVKARQIDGIVCWHPDRLYRRFTDLEALTDLLASDQALTVYSVKAANMKLQSSDGELLAGVLALTSRFEVRHKAERQTARHREIAAKGMWHGGKLPTGYLKGQGKGELVIDEPVAKALRDCADLLLRGHSLRSVTRHYQAETGHKMADTALRRVLAGPVIAGKRIYAPEESKSDQVRLLLPSHVAVVEANWKPILDKETWLGVRRILLDPSRKTRGRSSDLSLLSGLLECSLCGKSLGYASKAYICNYTSGGCNKTSISTRLIEQLIEGQVEAMIRGKEFTLPERSHPDTAARLADQEAYFENEKRKAFELYRQSILTSEQFEAKVAALNESIQELSSEAEPAAERTTVRTLIDQWDIAGRPERRLIIKTLIRKILVYPPDPERARPGRFDPARIDIDWQDGAPIKRRKHRVEPGSQVAEDRSRK